ncbi:MAG: hypothetical protein MJZ92_03435 [Paludibacteraceae bacterium]|nr:hypothetical protein [Paludibacteraceae bacterium]
MKQLYISILFLVGLTPLWAGEHYFSVSGDKQAAFKQGVLQSASGTLSVDAAPWKSPSAVYRFSWSTERSRYGLAKPSAKDTRFVDWGGAVAGQNLKTLSVEEWEYLLYDRNNAASLVGLGTVSGTAGMIILPDVVELPAGFSSYVDAKSTFKDNVYSASQWQVMQSIGAVFLPAIGSDEQDGKQGNYWTSSREDNEKAYTLSFQNGFIGIRSEDIARQLPVCLVADAGKSKSGASHVGGQQGARKVVRDGQIMIYYNGQWLNLLGKTAE